MKRAQDEQLVTDEQSKKRSKTTPIICFPGASGRFTALNRELLQSIPNTRLIELKWNTFKPSHINNIKLVNENLVKDCFVLGNSFGNRVLLEMGKMKLFDSLPMKFIFLGYPLFGPKESNDRMDLLKSCEELDCCFVSGQEDEFLNRTYLQGNGVELMRNLVKDKELLMVEKGRHSVPDCKGIKSSKKLELERVKEFIIKFVEN